MKESTLFVIMGVIAGLIPITFISLIILIDVNESVGLENIENLHECFGLVSNEKAVLAHTQNHSWDNFEISFYQLDCDNYYNITNSKTWIEFQVEKTTWNDKRL